MPGRYVTSGPVVIYNFTDKVMAIHMMHGVDPDWIEGRFVHRIYVSATAFWRYLRWRTRYVRWTADQTKDVLMIDDATRGGADACLMARELGHEVHFFVNPFQVISGHPYFFTVLDRVLDTRTVQSIEYKGQAFELRTAREALEFRHVVKRVLMRQSAESSLMAVGQIADLLGATSLDLPEHALPLTLSDLIALRDAGVQLENHGWTHVDVSALTDDEFQVHIGRAQHWLQSELAVDANLYAVPFGLANIESARRRWIEGAYFLADPSRAPGPISDCGWNRENITPQLQRLGAKS